MKDGFVRVGAAAPRVRVADCAFNAKKITEAMSSAWELVIKLLVFPELSVTGYTCGDLFGQSALRKEAENALGDIVKASVGHDAVIAVGLPVADRGRLYNCAAVLQNGRLLGLVPKENLPNYGVFCESRRFSRAFSGMREIKL